jgi:hypothetical protein
MSGCIPPVRRKPEKLGSVPLEVDALEQKLLFALVYQKTYPLQVLLGEVFDLSQPRTNYWIHHLLPVLKQALDDLSLIPERDPHQFASHEKRQGELSKCAKVLCTFQNADSPIFMLKIGLQKSRKDF